MINEMVKPDYDGGQRSFHSIEPMDCGNSTDAHYHLSSECPYNLNKVEYRYGQSIKSVFVPPVETLLRGHKMVYIERLKQVKAEKLDAVFQRSYKQFEKLKITYDLKNKLYNPYSVLKEEKKKIREKEKMIEVL